MEGERKCIKHFGGRYFGKHPLEMLRRRWESNIKMDAIEIGCDNVNWIEQVQIHVQWWTIALMVLEHLGSITRDLISLVVSSLIRL
jgi:hypothetical protein